MKQRDRSKVFKKLLSGFVALAMVLPLFPSQLIETEAGVPGLVGTKSLVFNQGTLYNYSDQYHRQGTLRTENQIAGKGDFNADTRAIAYAQNPGAENWEGIYFGSGALGNETFTTEVPVGTAPYNIAKDCSIAKTSSSENELKDGSDGLWNDDTGTKAWTTWTSNSSEDTSGYIVLKNEQKQDFNTIKLYFLLGDINSDPNSIYPQSVVVSGSNDEDIVNTNDVSDDDYEIITTVLTNFENNSCLEIAVPDNVDMSSYSYLNFTFIYGTNENKYIMLTEIKLEGEKTITVTENNTITKQIAKYNTWTGNTVWNTNGQTRSYVYSGLVKDTLVNGQIQFSVPEAGLFTQDTSNKEVYNNIRIPFIYDSQTGYYEFNAGPQNDGGYGYHFDINYDGTITESEKVSGGYLTIDDNHFGAYDVVNGNNNVQGFFPFNAPQLVDESDSSYATLGRNAIYHFGMNVSVKFAMTDTGTVDGTENGEPITFEFSGDDDVWVFIDNQLVLDLGGIHDSVSAKIDFKENKISMWSTDPKYGSGDLNVESDFADNSSIAAGHVTDLGQILNSEEAVGKIAQSYQNFAGETEHILTVFYLERGRGESNCKIKYNLPHVDALEVTKNIQLGTKDGETRQEITPEEWVALNALDFKMRVRQGENIVTGKYNLYESSNYIGTYTTDAEGYFVLKNNQTARFVKPIGGNYVVEEYAAESHLPAAVWGKVEWSGSVEGNKLPNSQVTNDNSTETDAILYDFSISSAETEQTASIVCTNYVYRPFVSVSGETQVIDYGLPVMIDIMKNDVQSAGKEFVLERISTPKYGTLRVLDRDENEVSPDVYRKNAGYYYLEYTPNTYMSDIEEISYTYKVQDSSFADGYAYPTAVATIIPATSMYYEENFLNSKGENYIKFSTASGFTRFEAQGTAINKYQEEGIVGTTTDSTYGTDVAYLVSNADSNGTSFKADTTNGPAAFQYTFTGTGTAFFGRTSEKSGYLKVTVKNSAGEDVVGSEESSSVYIDTKYAVTDAELYNIPVFNIEDLEYDTYTVTVIVAKPSQWYLDQNEFYLDGVRVYNPINMGYELDDNGDEVHTYSKYETVYNAYHMDSEMDANVVTLRDYMIDTQTDVSIDEVNDIETIVWSEGSQVMFTDSNKEIITASEYISNGPKQELYMTSKQAIRFVLKDWYKNKPSEAKIYLGAKNPEGTTGSFTVNKTPYTICNTTDCYYDITSAVIPVQNSLDGLVVITVGESSGLISFTNLKCTEYVDFALAGMDEIVGNEGEDQTVQVFSLLRRTITADVTTGEDINSGETDESMENPEGNIENPEGDTEVSDENSGILDDEENKSEETSKKPSNIVSEVVSVVKQVVSVVKNVLSKWFGR